MNQKTEAPEAARGSSLGFVATGVDGPQILDRLVSGAD